MSSRGRWDQPPLRRQLGQERLDGLKLQSPWRARSFRHGCQRLQHTLCRRGGSHARVRPALAQGVKSGSRTAKASKLQTYPPGISNWQGRRGGVREGHRQRQRWRQRWQRKGGRWRREVHRARRQ